MSEENKSSGLKVFFYTCGIAACGSGAVISHEASVNYDKAHNIPVNKSFNMTHEMEAANANNIYSIWAEACAAGLALSTAGLLMERRKNTGR